MTLALSALGTVDWAAAAAPVDTPVKRSPLSPTLAISPPVAPSADTQCEACHRAEGWDEAVFAHDKTGFPLTGRHQKVGCRECHVQSLQAPLPRACGGCHRDAHSGEFGTRCEGCHETAKWDTTFTVDAHRRTNFPLVGSHAVIPCQECHTDSRGRTFTRPTVQCINCHQRDFNQTALTSISHVAAGFSTSCRDCHSAWRFKGGIFPGHDSCFQITGGKHTSIGCLSCHTTLVGLAGNTTCSTGTASCTSCHTHTCQATDSLHTSKNVPGYECKDQKCYSCHRFASGQ